MRPFSAYFNTNALPSREKKIFVRGDMDCSVQTKNEDLLHILGTAPLSKTHLFQIIPILLLELPYGVQARGPYKTKE